MSKGNAFSGPLNSPELQPIATPTPPPEQDGDVERDNSRDLSDFDRKKRQKRNKAITPAQDTGEVPGGNNS